MANEPQQAGEQSCRDYQPALIVFGIIPSIALLITGTLYAIPVVEEIVEARSLELPDGLPLTFFPLATAVLNLLTFQRRRLRLRRPIFWLAILANACVVLQSLHLWKHSIEHLGGLIIPVGAAVLGVSGGLCLVTLSWSHSLRSRSFRFGLKQLGGLVLCISVFMAAAGWIVNAEQLSCFREQAPVARHFMALGGHVRWEIGR